MKKNVSLCIIALFAAITLSTCATIRKNDFSQYNLSLKNTLAIFLLNNEKGWYFCIPVQYLGDYQIARFKFDNGNIQIDDYELLLKRNEINISIYLNETANEDGNIAGIFNLIYLEKNGKVLISKMAEPLAAKKKSGMLNHYYIFIEKYLTKNEIKKIINKYESGNVSSKFSIWYDLTIDNKEQNNSGLLDNFELYDGLAIDPAMFPPNLDFFKVKYLGK